MPVPEHDKRGGLVPVPEHDRTRQRRSTKDKMNRNLKKDLVMTRMTVRRMIVRTMTIIMIIGFILLLILAPKAYGNQEETMQEQQTEFGIQDFLKNSKEFTGEFFQGMDLGEILGDAIKGEVDNGTIGKRILSLLGSEVVNATKAIGSILVIIVIHSVLKSISESLENENIAKLIYYAQYILIITIILSNFSDIVKLVQDTTTNLVAFMNLLVPLLITLMMATGSIATSRNDRTDSFIYDKFYW